MLRLLFLLLPFMVSLPEKRASFMEETIPLSIHKTKAEVATAYTDSLTGTDQSVRDSVKTKNIDVKEFQVIGDSRMHDPLYQHMYKRELPNPKK